MDINNDFVTVKLSREPSAILLSHLIALCLDQVVSLACDSIDELLRVRRITNALKELDSLLTFKLLKLAVLLDEFLLIN